MSSFYRGTVERKDGTNPINVDLPKKMAPGMAPVPWTISFIILLVKKPRDERVQPLLFLLATVDIKTQRL